MPRRRYIFDPPERFIAGTVGEPGDRTFFLQARDGGRITSVALEKVQVAALAQRLGDLLEELERRGVEGAEDQPGIVGDTAAMDEPINEAFRAPMTRWRPIWATWTSISARSTSRSSRRSGRAR
jgi:uncharacterized repeat protein (TIGR03847 family)